jgi:hypothetical protein
MKTRFRRFSSGRSFARLLSLFVFLAIATPGLSLAQEWGAFDPSSWDADYKTIIDNKDLVCDLGDPLSTVVMVSCASTPCPPGVTLPPGVTPPFFRFGSAPDVSGNPLLAAEPAKGQIVCGERNHGSSDPLDPVGVFTLIQARSDNGLGVFVCSQGDQSCADGGPVPDGVTATKRTTFIYKITDKVKGVNPNENLLYRLIPANQATRDAFCFDGTQRIPDALCGANIGLSENGKGTFITFGGNTYYDGGGDGELASDYRARDVSSPPDGENDLLDREVFRFTTEKTVDGIETPKRLVWGPCSAGRWNLSVAVACQFGTGQNIKATTVKGSVTGGLIVPIDLQSDNSANSSLNMSQTSGTYPVAIVGTQAVPVGTITNPNFAVTTGSPSGVLVNGNPVRVARIDVFDETSPGSNGPDTIPDLVIYFDKASFVNAVRPTVSCVNGSRVTLTLSGTLSDTESTPWRGTDAVALTNCNN